MVQNVNPTFVKTPNRGVTLISTGTGTALVTAYTGATSGTKIASMNLVNNSTAALVVRVIINSATVNYFLAAISVPTNAGMDGATASVNPFTLCAGLPVDSDGNSYLILASTTDLLQVQTTAVVPTATGSVYCYTVAGDF